MKRILVIDDEPIITLSCSKALTAEGYEVHTSLSGLEGLEMFYRGQYDLVIVDNKMPGIDGFEVLSKIKDHKSSQKVVIISGYSTLEQQKKAEAYGALFYLEKPFTPDELLDVVKKALSDEG